MDVHKRIRELMEEKQWSEYRLAKMSGLSQSAISNLFKRNTLPSIPTLEAICNGLNITLSQFFAEENLVELTPEQKEMFDRWMTLSDQQKQVLYDLIQTM